MDNNLSHLNDLYLCVIALNPSNKKELLEFLDVQIMIEEDVAVDY